MKDPAKVSGDMVKPSVHTHMLCSALLYDLPSYAKLMRLKREKQEAMNQ